MAYTDDWESLMNGVFGAGGKLKFGGAQPQPEKEETGDALLNLDTARRFAAVLEKEQQLMQDAQAREELAAMHKTTTAICDWLGYRGYPAHLESGV